MQKVMGAEGGMPGANVRFAQGFQDLFSVSRTAALDSLHTVTECTTGNRIYLQEVGRILPSVACQALWHKDTDHLQFSELLSP